MVSAKYYDVTHRDGKFWIEHSMVLRRMTEQLLASEESKIQFAKSLKLPEEYVDKVYNKYVQPIVTCLYFRHCTLLTLHLFAF